MLHCFRFVFCCFVCLFLCLFYTSSLILFLNLSIALRSTASHFHFLYSPFSLLLPSLSFNSHSTPFTARCSPFSTSYRAFKYCSSFSFFFFFLLSSHYSFFLKVPLSSFLSLVALCCTILHQALYITWRQQSFKFFTSSNNVRARGFLLDDQRLNSMSSSRKTKHTLKLDGSVYTSGRTMYGRIFQSYSTTS